MTHRTRLSILVTGLTVILLTATIGFAAPLEQENQTATAISATGTSIFEATARAETQTANIALATQQAENSPVTQVLRRQAHDTGGRIHVWTDQHIITSDDGGIIKVWDAESLELIATLDFGYQLLDADLGHLTPAVQLNGDETRLLTWNKVSRDCACEFNISVWNIDRNAEDVGALLFNAIHDDPTDFVGNSGANWNSDGTMIASWGRDGNIRLWDAQTGEELGILRNGSNVWGVDWTRDSRRLVGWSVGRAARVWDIEALLQQEGEEVPTTSAPLLTLRHDDAVTGAMWSEDETQILTWSFDGNAALWDVETGLPVVIMSHGNIIWRALWDGNRIITSSFDDTVRVWTPETTTGIGQSIEPDAIMFYPDGNFFWTSLNAAGDTALSAYSGTHIVWSMETGGQYFSLPGTAQEETWHPSGQYLLAVVDGSVVVFAVPSGEQVSLITDTTLIDSARWSPDGRQILTLADDGMLALWEPTLLPSTAVAQAPTALPTPTYVPPSTIDPNGPSPTPTSVRSYSLGPSFERMQSFVAAQDRIASVDLRLSQRTDEEPFGDVLTVSILDREGSTLTSTEQFVPPGFNDWLRITFDEAVTVEAGEAYILAIASQLDTDNPPRWAIIDNRYPDGVGGVDFEFSVGYDFQFRFNATEVALSIPHVTITPTMTPTPTLTPTTIPPAETATLEADWYRTGIFSTTNPRLAGIDHVPTGGSLDFFLGDFGCCYFIDPVDNFDVTWSIDRADMASIDAESGLLTVKDDAEPGVIAVSASANGLSQTIDVHVYDADAQPYIGVWAEVDRRLCSAETFTESGVLVREFILRADGRFAVTWDPFEVYVDYVGDYTIDGEAIVLDDQEYNYNPPVFRGDGTWFIDDQGRLVLEDIWLGISPFGETDEQACAHRFEKLSG